MTSFDRLLFLDADTLILGDLANERIRRIQAAEYTFTRNLLLVLGAVFLRKDIARPDRMGVVCLGECDINSPNTFAEIHQVNVPINCKAKIYCSTKPHFVCIFYYQCIQNMFKWCI